MKRLLIFVSVLGTALLALGATGLAFAQTESPQPFTNPGYGQGMMDTGDRYEVRMVDGEVGPYHEDILGSFAEALGITVDQLEARLEGGETMWQIVEAEGATWEEFITIMQQARETIMQQVRETKLEQAVEDGTMNQEQADFMNIRSQGRVFNQEYDGCMGYDDGDQQSYQRGSQGRWNAP